jgi:hypothetical protein
LFVLLCLVSACPAAYFCSDAPRRPVFVLSDIAAFSAEAMSATTTAGHAVKAQRDREERGEHSSSSSSSQQNAQIQTQQPLQPNAAPAGLTSILGTATLPVTKAAAASTSPSSLFPVPIPLSLPHSGSVASVSPAPSSSSPASPASQVPPAAATVVVRTADTQKRKDAGGFKHMIAGSLAGMASRTMLQPLDLVKVRLQVQDGKGPNEYKGRRQIEKREGKGKQLENVHY